MPFSYQNLIVLFISYFFVLLNYSLIRASTTTFFLEAFKAKATPIGWFISVFILSLTIGIMNRLQKKWGMHKLFLVFSLFSGFIFLESFFLHLQGQGVGSYSLYVWKEVYIVIQVHLLLAYTNSWLDREHFLKWIGPLGAIGSLGGIFGGLLTSWISDNFGTTAVFYTGLFFTVLPGITAFFTLRINHSSSTPASPFESLNTKEIKRYVFLIVALTLLSQFVINIADFQFNLVFEKNLTDANARTSFLGKIYSLTNFATLVIQVIFVPFIFRFVSSSSLHFFIPLSYILSISLGVSLNSELILVSSGLYLYLKSADYSLFSGAKELLYQPLKAEQKYGVKYLTDMLSYRAGKALISLVLLYLQNTRILTVLMLSFLILWIILLAPLFKLQKQMKLS